MKSNLQSVRHLVVTVAVLAMVPVSAFAASDWEIDAAHSTASFSVRHMMVSNVRGQFDKVTGTFHYDDKDVSKSTAEATIDVSTIDTNEPKRDAHLKSAEFFDVEKYPAITFKSTKVAKAGKGKLKVTGDLTMHGVTKQVTLDVEGPTAPAKDPWGNTKIGVSATTTVNRRDFGLNWNKTLETGGVLVGDDVKITLDLELGEKKPAEAASAKDTGKTEPAAAKK